MKFLKNEKFKLFDDCCLVSNLGRVYSLASEQFITPFKNKDGYLLFRIWKNGIRKAYYLHITLVNLFGDCNGKQLPESVKNGTQSMLNLDLNIDHIDRNKLNCDLSNLEIVSHSENMHRYYKSLECSKEDIELLEAVFS